MNELLRCFPHIIVAKTSCQFGHIRALLGICDLLGATRRARVPFGWGLLGHAHSQHAMARRPSLVDTPDSGLNAGRFGLGWEQMPDVIRIAYDKHESTGKVLWWSQRAVEFSQMPPLQYASAPLMCYCCMAAQASMLRKNQLEEYRELMVVTEQAVQLFSLLETGWDDVEKKETGVPELKLNHQRLHDQVMGLKGAQKTYTHPCGGKRVVSGIKWMSQLDSEERVDGSRLQAVNTWFHFDDAAGEVMKSYKLMASIASGHHASTKTVVDDAPPVPPSMQRDTTPNKPTPRVV